MASVTAYRRSSIVCGRGFARRRLALADVQVEPDALVELLFLGVLAQDRFEQVGGRRVVVALERLEAAFVQRDGLEIGRAPLRQPRTGAGRAARPTAWARALGSRARLRRDRLVGA